MTVHSHFTRSHRMIRLHTSFAAVALASLAACGGSDGDSSTTAFAPVTLTGKVIINQGIKGATVCMDVNANSACDTGEPTSAATGVDGAYSLTYDPAMVTAEQVGRAALLANIPATTAVDAAQPTVPVTAKGYLLSAPAGKPDQINPLTTLVQAGVASGLTLAKSEAAVALQLSVPAAEIYDYQANASDLNAVLDNARNMAGVVAYQLDAGVPLSVVEIAATVADSNQLATLNYSDVNNYFVRTFLTKDLPGTGKRQTTDTRKQLQAGTALGDGVLFQQAYLTPTGWVRTSSAGFAGTRGSPSRSDFGGGGLPSVSLISEAADISGKAMVDVVKGLQGVPGNSITLADTTALGVSTFPAGSQLVTRKGANIGQAIFINNLNSTNEVNLFGGVATLEGLIAGRLPSTLNLSNGGGTYFAGNVDSTHWLMMRYLDAVSKIAYYSCVPNAAQTAVSDCVYLKDGTFKIKTVNGVRVMSFEDQPATSVGYTIGHAEYNGGVARVRINKTDLANAATVSLRLNGTAWDAMKTVLGL